MGQQLSHKSFWYDDRVYINQSCREKSMSKRKNFEKLEPLQDTA